MDFSSLARFYDFVTSTNIATTNKTMGTYTIPSDGLYLLDISCNLHSVASSHVTYIDINKNGTVIDSSYVSIDSNDWGYLGYARTWESFSKGDIITVAMRDTVGISSSTNTKVRISLIQLV